MRLAAQVRHRKGTNVRLSPVHHVSDTTYVLRPSITATNDACSACSLVCLLLSCFVLHKRGRLNRYTRFSDGVNGELYSSFVFFDRGDLPPSRYLDQLSVLPLLALEKGVFPEDSRGIQADL